ncbi:MAG: hypothetical protein JRG95_25515, partial [Deltaproteobacteria bacterium]|nr:hypothetical protein [Deltaproteobacteria bacterium]
PLACTEPLEFADWTIPVPEGTPIIEYAAVPMEERTERIELVEELVIGDEGLPETRFYHAFDVGVDHEGNIYVFDAGNYRIQVFSHDGEFLRTIGGRGEGPMEISYEGGDIAVGGGQIIHESRSGQVSIWTLEGEHIFRGESGVGQEIWEMAATDAQQLIGIHTDPEIRGAWNRAIGSLGPEEYSRFSDLPVPARLAIVRTGAPTTTLYMRMAQPIPAMAVCRDGAVYFTTSEEYQVFGVEASGKWRWALRVAWPRLALTNADIETTLARARERLPDAARSEVGWPEYYPALSVDSSWWERSAHGYPVRVDGHGNVYVFPLIWEDRMRQWTERDAHILRPVDVYGPDGERLFSGMMKEVSWHDAWGDYIYGIELNEQTDEQRVFRYRLVEPF